MCVSGYCELPGPPRFSLSQARGGWRVSGVGALLEQSTEQGEEGEEGCNLVSTSVSAGVCACVCVFWHYRVFFG